MAGTVTPTLTPAQILAHLNALGTSGALFDASVFALKDPSAPTKIGKFSAAGITAGQTRTYTLPDATGTVPLLGLAQTWSATQTFGAIDATSIGGTTRGTGAFTTLAANGATTLTAGTASTSTTTGTLVVTGGTGISGAAWIGGTLNVAGASTLAAVAATTVSASGQITSTVSTGTAPLVIASTTAVANLNASLLLGSTWAAPGTIGSGTPSTGAFTTISASGVITSTLATGTAPFTVASTTVVANLNASFLSGKTHADPGPIGSGTASTGAFTTLTASGATTLTAGTASSSTTTGTLVVTGGAGISGAAFIGSTLSVAGRATINSGNAENGITVGNSTNGFCTVQMLNGSTHYGWLIGTQNNFSETFEITPSTVVGGTTFSVPALKILNTGATTINVTNTGTTDEPLVLTIGHNTTGTPASGFGCTFRINAQTTTTADTAQAAFISEWVDATHASRTGQLSWFCYDASAARECMRFKATGSAAAIGFLGASASVRQAVTGSRGGNAALASLLTAMATLGLITDSSS